MKKSIFHAGEKILNISPQEYSRTGYSWILRFLLKAGLVAGWTAIISIFVTEFGVSSLPFLFMIQASFAIFGTVVFSFLVNRMDVLKLQVGSAFIAGMLLFSATFFKGVGFVFFPLVLIATGIFLPQLEIFLSNFIEEIFTPSESERTYPIIESADTIGALTGGIILAFSLLGGDSHQVLYLWVLCIFAFIAAIFVFQPRSPKFHTCLYEMKILEKEEKINWDVLKRSMKEIRKMHFLQILAVVFFMQWMLTHLLEFQYVKVVEENVLAATGTTHEGNGLTQGLGMLQMIFSGSAIIMQLLMASRILRFIGTFGGFLFHSLICFMSSLMMMFGFGYFTTVLMKNNFELSGIVNKNAYHASYYAFRHGTQKSIGEFFEGIIAPAGTLVATLLLLLIRNFFIDEHSLLAINLLLVLMTGFILLISGYLQKAYTSMVRENMFRSGHRIAKLNSIEILAQKGHRQSTDILLDALRHEKDPEMRVKIIYSLRKIGDIRGIPAILECLHEYDKRIIIAAVHAISDHPVLRHKDNVSVFSKRKATHDLRSLFEKNDDFEVKTAALRAIAHTDDNPAEFMLSVLEQGDHNLKAECIKFMGTFADPAVAEYIYPYLKSSDPFVRAWAVIVTAKVRGLDRHLMGIIDQMIMSSRKDVILAAGNILPGLNSPRIRKWAMGLLANKNDEIRLYASAGLLRAGVYDAGECLADLLLEGNELILSKARHLLKNMRMSAKHLMSDLLQKKAVQIAGCEGENVTIAKVVEKMDEKLLNMLVSAYKILGLDEEKEFIHAIMEYRGYMSQDQKKPTTLPYPELAI